MESGVSQKAIGRGVMSGGGREFQFLCRAVGCALGCQDPGSGGASPEEVNQVLLLQSARRHRCLPLLAAGLERGRQEGFPAWVTVAPDVQAGMTRLLAIGAGRAVFLSRRLLALLDVFGASGIRAMALKGPAMAEALYGHVEYRPSDDLDVWIHPQDFAEACGVMEALGFTPLVRLTPVEARAHMKAGWDRGFRSPAGDYVVELGTGMAPRYFARPPDANAFWAGAREVSLEGGLVRTPGLESLLELLCLHGTKHGWSRLLWVADVAVLGGARGGIDWVTLGRQTTRNGTARMTALGLTLARRHLGVNTPGGPVSRELEQCATRFLSGEDRCVGFVQELKFHLAGRERWRDRVRYVILVLFTPSFGDWQKIRLPRGFFWLHWVLRPVRLLMWRSPRNNGKA